MGQVEVVNKVTVSGSITLGDLRQMLDQCRNLDDSSRVEVERGRDVGPREMEPDRITVHGKPAANKPTGGGFLPGHTAGCR